MDMDTLDLTALPSFGDQEALLECAPQELFVDSAIDKPVARVHVVMPQPHMDKVFDYLVPPRFDNQAQVGMRVKVRVGSQRVSGFIVERTTTSRWAHHLRTIESVPGKIPVLKEHIYREVRLMAARQASGVSDILRLAVPERHARAEKSVCDEPEAQNPRPSEFRGQAWAAYEGGEEFLRKVYGGQSPKAVLSLLPGLQFSTNLVMEAIIACRNSGRGVLVITPLTRHARSLATEVETQVGEEVSVIVSDGTHEDRYRSFIRTLRGSTRITVGTRAALWAPVKNLGLILLLDDLSPHLRELRSPYSDARDVCIVRSEHENAAYVSMASYISEENMQYVRNGFLSLLQGKLEVRKDYMPAVSLPSQWSHSTEEYSRLPHAVFQLMRQALPQGPVLIVVPHAGYLSFLVCSNCRTHAVCQECGGDMSKKRQEDPYTCVRCGWYSWQWRCPECHGTTLRALRIGSQRTAEEIGRAFPGTGIILSGTHSPDGVVWSVDNTSRIIVATPGAEPRAQKGYAAAIVVDSRYLIGYGLGSHMRFIRKLAHIVTRVRPSRQGGHVLLSGGAPPEVIEPLTTWNMGVLAGELLDERKALELPPSKHWLAISGKTGDVRTYLAMVRDKILAMELAGRNTTGAHNNASGNTNSAGSSEGNLSDEWQPELLRGGSFTITKNVDFMGPVPGSRPGENTVYIRYPREHERKYGMLARDVYGSYAAQHLGGSLKLELNPSM
ncbi:primosomal protein N' family DNA-binding protein [Actinotignum urinale]|uniref:primosomal protein N' family DNA-binding protein n=2 Tax=Actinotignum urinale TaxID=190146 RepID=UPI0003B3F422|nr:hypothetical protein [Actinotignum urinale]